MQAIRHYIPAHTTKNYLSNEQNISKKIVFFIKIKFLTQQKFYRINTKFKYFLIITVVYLYTSRALNLLYSATLAITPALSPTTPFAEISPFFPLLFQLSALAPTC